MNSNWMQSPLVGAGLVAGYTLAVTATDAMVKHLALGFEAPQVLVICSATILLIILGTSVAQGKTGALRTSCPKPMAVRAVMTVAASILFFYSFALLPFAEVFLFIGMVPIFTGLLSAPILKEQVKPAVWGALCLGSMGVFLLFPGGWASVGLGHVVAFAAAICGTLAIVMARLIAREEDKPLALVFYPQLLILVAMAAVCPFVWKPIGGYELACAIFCGATLFGARYALALALQILPAYAATPLINLQFVWMAVIGFVIFKEIPASHTVLGALVIICSGLFLVFDQWNRMRAPSYA